MIKKTPLDSWIGKKLKISMDDRHELDEYILHSLNQIVRYSSKYSVFYSSEVYKKPINSIADFENLPTIYPSDVANFGMKLLCVSQSEIERVVTLSTTGTTGNAKRLYFTKEDQELTVDFFHYGMKAVSRPAETTMILLPHKAPGGVGDLLIKGLTRLGCKAFGYGMVEDINHCVFTIEQVRAKTLVGVPCQVLAVAQRYKNLGKKSPVERVLLSTDSLCPAQRIRIEEGLRCTAFDHFGMTETGFGGALECEAHRGLHVRENDLYFEVLPSCCDRPAADGEWGELAVTTLTRRGMPLIRYRTGDSARFLTGQCPCKSILKRLDRISGRIGDELTPLLDEALFSVEQLVDYRAYRDKHGPILDVLFLDSIPKNAKDIIEERVRGLAPQGLSINLETTCGALWKYAGKRIQLWKS